MVRWFAFVLGLKFLNAEESNTKSKPLPSIALAGAYRLVSSRGLEPLTPTMSR
jgi:hypothetical protein